MRPPTLTHRHGLTLNLLLLIGACSAADPARTTPEAYASLQQAVRTDPNASWAQTAECIRTGMAAPQAHREWLAAQLNTSPDDAVAAYCVSLTRALAMAAINYQDVAALTDGGADRPAASRVLEAVLKHAGSVEAEVARQLDACAQLYAEGGQHDAAAGSAGHATRLRALEHEHLQAITAAAQGRPYPTSTWLGFAPDAELASCAAEFRARGRSDDAAGAEMLAQRYRDDQTRTVEALLPQARRTRPQPRITLAAQTMRGSGTGMMKRPPRARYSACWRSTSCS